MKGLKYKVIISDDPTGVHSAMRREIEEVYVPELDLFLNAEAAFISKSWSRVPKKTEAVEINMCACIALRDALLNLEKWEKYVRGVIFGAKRKSGHDILCEENMKGDGLLSGQAARLEVV